MKLFGKLSEIQLEEILTKVGKANVGMIGDLCLDIYWKADMTRSELSRETPHFPLPIVEERMSPGGGGNLAANIAALRPAKIKAIGVVGDDWRGKALLRELENRGIDDSNIVICRDVMTNTYCKPIRMGISDVEYEDPRLDFCNYRGLPGSAEKMLLDNLDRTVKDLDVLCVTDQFIFGCITPAVRKKLIQYAAEGLTVIVDSRDKMPEYRGVIMKPNEIEAWRIVQDTNLPPADNLEQYVEIAGKLARINRAPVCMTIGPKGCLYSDGQTITHVSAYAVEPPIDIVGAGDTFLAAFGTAIAAGIDPVMAASFGNLASSITIKKIGTTGTSSQEELRKALKANV